MNIHKNARLTSRGREWVVSQGASGQTPKAVAEAVGVCPRTVRKWVARYRAEGAPGLCDRSSRPRRFYRPTPKTIVEPVEMLRRQRLTGKAIAADVGVSPATVSRILKRLGLDLGFGICLLIFTIWIPTAARSFSSSPRVRCLHRPFARGRSSSQSLTNLSYSRAQKMRYR